MALFHFNVTPISRGKGRSAVASAAYIAGEKIYDEYYGKTHDYTKKSGVLYSEILLPDNAPERLKDRKTLWNEIEKNEKHPKAQLCYSFNFALQNELSAEENHEIVRRFISEQFLSKGMIVDYAIHNPEKNGVSNPHVHMLIPIRPLKEDGSWGNKQHREYLYDENHNPIQDENGKPKFKAVSNTDWGNPETLLKWRESYANLFNQAFEENGLPCRITHQSFESLGIDKLPTIHEGPTVRAMEARGIQTEIGNHNRKIKLSNRLLEKLGGTLSDIIDWLCEFIKECKKEKIYAPTIGSLVNDYYQNLGNMNRSRQSRIRTVKEISKVILFLEKNNVESFEDLSTLVRELYGQVNSMQKELEKNNKEIRKITDLLRYREMYQKYEPIYNQLNSILLPGKKEKFKSEHSAELNQFFLARRKKKEYWGDSNPDWASLKTELEQLSKKHEILSRQYAGYKETAKIGYRIKCITEEMMKVSPENATRPVPGKKHEPQR